MKITLEHVYKSYGSFNAVADFNFEFPDGQLVAMLGPSGCGKSTCLNMISGLATPTQGKIYFGDRDVTNTPPEDRGVGMVFQEYALYPHLTVFQNIAFPLENKKVPKEEIKKLVQEVARMVDIAYLLERKPRALSGGQRQRVAIARALVKSPKVLLLDEPLSNLDARLRLQTREEIRKLQRMTGVTTVFVTHDQDEAMSIADMIIVMKDGIVQQTGKPQTVFDDPINLFVARFLGTPPLNIFDGVIRDGGLYLGNDRLGRVGKEVPDGEVLVGIRPEALVPDLGGYFHCGLERVEVQGRDINAVFTNDALSGYVTFGRATIPSECDITGQKEVTFAIKPEKLFIFDKDTELRIHTDFTPFNAEYLLDRDDGSRSKD